MSAATAGRGPRPGIITVLAVLALIEAALSAAVGIVLLVEQDDVEFRLDVGYSSSDLITFAIAALVHAAVVSLVAFFLLRGSDTARLFAAVLACLAIAGYIFALVELGTPVLAQAILGIAFWVLILYALYGYEPSRRFFGDEPPSESLAA
jgi:hypothetical protein